jgi:hypothetical protein
MPLSNEKEYATIQINRQIKDEIVKLCHKRGMKIGRYIERLFIHDVSGSIPPVGP